MKNYMIDSEEKIRKIIELTDNPRYIEATKRTIDNFKNVTEDDILLITTMSIGEAIKAIIPEKNYKDLAIEISFEDTDDNHKCTLGFAYEKNRKYNVKYCQLNKDVLLSKDYDKDIFDIFSGFIAFAHEIYHVKQFIEAKEEKITFDSFLVCLERGLQFNVPGFYKKEYSNLYMENSADGVGIIMTTNFFEKYGSLSKDRVPELRKHLFERYKPGHHTFANDNELKEYIRKLLKILRDNINTFDRKYDNDIFIKFPMLRYLINPRTGELESPERLQTLINDTYMIEDKLENQQRLRLLKILKELSIERQQSISQYK